MDQIKCPECGAEMPRSAAACGKCGHPLALPQGELTIYGIKQKFLIGGTVDVLLDGVVVAKVRKNEKITLPIVKDYELTIRCGINVMRGRKTVYAGQKTEIQVVYDRLTGGFKLNELE